jgi:hypothetical protein
VSLLAVPIQHSIRAPTVGYRVSARGTSFFYAPDIAALPKVAETLGGIDVYVGDGATIKRTMVRKSGRSLIGHAPIGRQLEWCERAGVRRAIFTHCGSAIVGSDGRRTKPLVRSLGRTHGVDAQVAGDGDRLSLPGGRLLKRGYRATR